MVIESCSPAQSALHGSFTYHLQYVLRRYCFFVVSTTSPHLSKPSPATRNTATSPHHYYLGESAPPSFPPSIERPPAHTTMARRSSLSLCTLCDRRSHPLDEQPLHGCFHLQLVVGAHTKMIPPKTQEYPMSRLPLFTAATSVNVMVKQ